MHWVSGMVDSPCYVEAVEVIKLIWVIIGISPIERVENIVGADSALVYTIVGQTASAEFYNIIINPHRVVGLRMVNVLGDVSHYAVRVGPFYIFSIAQETFLVGYGDFVVVGAFITN